MTVKESTTLRATILNVNWNARFWFLEISWIVQIHSKHEGESQRAWIYILCFYYFFSFPWFDYIETITGRKRYFQRDQNNKLDQKEQRQSVNSTIQGTAADILLASMILLNQQLSRFNAQIIIQIHDELIIECPNDQVFAANSDYSWVDYNCLCCFPIKADYGARRSRLHCKSLVLFYSKRNQAF